MIQKLGTYPAWQPLTQLRDEDFQSRFNRAPFKIGHVLENHPLFSLPSLIKLSNELPTDRVEYNAGNLPISQDPKSTPQNGLSIEETISRIENCQSWMVLKNVELSTDYQNLLETSLDQIEPFAQSVSGKFSQCQAFIFVSSPNSVTPFHVDPENNFLLQIRGKKTVWMFDPKDREVLKEKEIEAFFSGDHRNLEFREEYRDRGQHFELLPGDGLHFPVVVPHFVENGPEVSVSFSITFQTEESSRRKSLYRFNQKLRHWGLSPSNVGEIAWRDACKSKLLNGLRAGKNAIRFLSPFGHTTNKNETNDQ